LTSNHITKLITGGGISWKSPNAIIGSALVLFGFVLFLVVILLGIGGTEALFAILGYVAAWVQMVVIFFFRKSPPETETTETIDEIRKE